MRTLVCIADLHSGSTYGLMPPKFHTKEGNEIGLNQIQKWYWKTWQKSWDWVLDTVGSDPWGLLINGDAIDGTHHGTKEIWSNDESDHGIAAYHLLKPYASMADSVLLTEGTEVHTKGHEHQLAYQLDSHGAKVVRPTEQGGAWPSIRMEMAGTLCKFDHHISATKRPYLEASALSIAMGSERVESARAGYKVPKVYGRAHRHKFGSFTDGYGIMFTTPPWQAATRHGRKFVPHAVIQAGIVILDWREREDGDLPDVKFKMFNPKSLPTIKI